MIGGGPKRPCWFSLRLHRRDACATCLIAKCYQMKRADTQVRPYNTPGFQVTRCIYPVFPANGLGIFPRTQNLKPKTRLKARLKALPWWTARPGPAVPAG